MFDIIIIGGGMAGMTASLYALRNNKSVLIIEKETIGGQITMSPKVENYPTIEQISGSELADKLFEQVSSLGAQIEVENVLSIEKVGDNFKVKTDYAEREARAVIIATGASARKLGIKNEDDLIGKGVYYCALCDGPFYAGKEVSLIGDANSALQYALMLADYCKKVHIFTLFDHFFGEENLIEAVKNNPKIDVRHNCESKAFVGEEQLTAIVFKDITTGAEFTHQTEAVFVAIGQAPHNENFANLVELDKNGYIVANDKCETKTSGVFVAGDTRVKSVRQVATAIGDGATAGTSAVKYLMSKKA